ncbi:MAG: hypothetical protein KGM42_01525 [Hyphomicrobiales bacterium]|nr:hypothetical protein [Hyphomicrobiales bacterium]
MIMTAKYRGAQCEWFAHQPLALEAGLAPEVAESIGAGRRPKAMKEDEASSTTS